MDIMKSAFMNKMKEKGPRRLFACALAFLLCLNILFTALPAGGFEKTQAASSTRSLIAAFDMEADSTLSLTVGMNKTPVLTGGDSADDYTFWTVIDGAECPLEGDPRITATANGNNSFTYNVTSENASEVKIFAETDSIASLKVEGEVNSLTLYGITSLTTLDASGITTLDEIALGNLTSLTNVDVSGGSIEKITLANLSALTTFDCSDNNLSYGTLLLPSAQPTNYTYAPQKDFEAPAFVNAGGVIDLTDTYVNAQTPGGIRSTQYTWYLADGTEITEGITGTGVLGKFTVDESLAGSTIYCVMSHGAFPELSQKTTNINVVDGLKFHAEDLTDPTVSFLVSDSDASVSVFVDGVDVTSQFAASDENGGKRYTADLTGSYGKLSVAASSPVKKIEIEAKEMTAFAADDCASLTDLAISGGENTLSLDNVDLSGCTALERLTINNTTLQEADLTANTSLLEADLCNNRLTDIELPAGVTSLKVSGNKTLGHLACIEGLSSTLETLYAADCGLAAETFEGFTALKNLDLSNNEINTLTLPENAFEYVNVAGNALNFGSLPAYPLTVPGGDKYIYAPQSKIEIADSYNVGDSADMSSNLTSSAAGDKVTATLTNGSDYTVSDSDGIFEIPEEVGGDNIHFTFTSEKFPELTLETTEAEVIENLQYRNAALIAESAGPFSFYITSTKPVLVDWGTGTPVEYSPTDGDYSKPYKVSGTSVADSEGNAVIHITTAGNVTALDLSRDADSTDKCTAAINAELWTELETLDLSGNKLTELDVSKNTALKNLDVSENSFVFAALPVFSGENYEYLSQSDVTINPSYAEGAEIDLSVYGADAWKWYNAATGEAVTPKSENSGKFTFGSDIAGKDIYCEMTNSDFPGLVIRTTKTRINAKEVQFDKPVAVLYTSLSVGEDVSLMISCDDTVYIDWGNGNITSDKTGNTEQYITEEALKGAAIKLYTNGKMTLLSATDLGINEVALTSATDLEVLNLSGNNLSKIDLSNNRKIKTLDLSDNCFIYSGLPATSLYENYTYIPQAKYKIPAMKASGSKLDALTVMPTPGGDMAYNWYKKSSSGDVLLSPSSDYTAHGGGAFTFNDKLANETVYCVVHNTAFDGLKITTTDMKILAGGTVTLADSNKFISTLVIEEGSTCKDSLGNLIPAGDLVPVASAANDTLLTFNAKKFTDSTAITSTTLLAKVKSKLSSFDASKGNYTIYDFYLTDKNGGNVTEFDGKINITLKYPNAMLASKYDKYTFYMFHYFTSGVKAGTMEEITVKAESDGISFAATSFSPFVLVYQTADNEGPSSGDGAGSGSGNGSGGGTGGTGNNAPSTGDGKGESGPETGDHSEAQVRTAQIVLWISIAVMVIIGIASVAAVKKGRRARYRR